MTQVNRESTRARIETELLSFSHRHGHGHEHEHGNITQDLAIEAMESRRLQSAVDLVKVRCTVIIMMVMPGLGRRPGAGSGHCLPIAVLVTTAFGDQCPILVA